MLKKIVLSCSAAVILASAFSATTFASANDVTVAPPIHWGKKSYDNTSGVFKSGKYFCRHKYFGKKTCIPGMNNTADTLTFSTTDYQSHDAAANMVAVLMGKNPLPSVVFTVEDSGKVVYTGPANNREGIICNQDKTTKAITCNAWK